MKIAVLAAALILAAPVAAVAQDHAHVVMQAKDLKWGPAPNALPPGAQLAVMYGDPTKDGQFAMRLKLPKGYHIPPHTHPKAEVVTVLAGDFRLGMGKTADKAKTEAISPGGFFAVEPGMEHFAYAEAADTVVQIDGWGPFSIAYVNPKDDPRSK